MRERLQKLAQWIGPRRAALGLLALIVSGPALYQLFLVSKLYAARFNYPWDIEWNEGPMLYQAYRMMHGQMTYGPPQIGYLPIMHPFLYYAIVAVVGLVSGGVTYGVGRSVTFFFFVLAAALFIRAFTRDEAQREEDGRKLEGLVAGLLAAGCMAAGAPLIQGFYDLVRPDMQAMSLCALGAVLAGGERLTKKRLAALAIVITAAIYTRLPIVFFLVWLLVFVFIRKRRAGIWLAVATTAISGLTLVALLLASKGWYWVYTVGIIQGHQVLPERIPICLRMMFDFAPFIVALPVIAAGLALKKRLSRQGGLWFGMFVASIPATMLPFLKVGGFANDFLPFTVFVGPATLFLLADVARAVGPRPRLRTALRWVGFAGMAAFLMMRRYDPKSLAPTVDMWNRVEKMNSLMAGLEGGVIAPRMTFLPIQNGHPNVRQYSDMPYLDMTWAGFTDLQLGRYIERTNAQWAIVTGEEVPVSAREIAIRYQLERALRTTPHVLIGEFVQPRHLLRKLDDETGGRVVFDFEKPLDDWTFEGKAFEASPTSTKPAWENTIFGAVGANLANSYHPALKDTATGTLTSPPFEIDRPRLAFRIGGGQSRKTRVDVKVGGKVVFSAQPLFVRQETLIKVVFDVSRLQGKKGQIVLVDEDPGSWGHLLCDHVVLY
ncbi:MAG TPA: hypothetical protein VK459_12800 [Polyangiaceae bacterium]|nr:hypothetical protein [Polyangiaceae bacterium]